MPVSVAYLAVVLIWSTTPLGIVWSSESVSPTLAVLMRMLIAVVLGLVIIVIQKIDLPWHKTARKLYSYSAVGIFGGMLLAYMAAAYISSGMMSLIFGTSPILSGIIAQKVLNEPKFGRVRLCAIFVSVIGLAIVCLDGIAFTENTYLGIIYIFGAVFFFSLSGVMVKSVQITIHPISTTVGSLLVCIPLFACAWWFMDGTLPIATWQEKSLWAILYLGIFGSLIGFIAYFFVLQKLNASTVALITMITPIIAIVLGALLNNEQITIQVFLGALLVMSGLWLYHFGNKIMLKLSVRQKV